MNVIVKDICGRTFESLNWWQRKSFAAFFLGTFTYVYCGTFKHECLDNDNPSGIQDFNKMRLYWTLFGRTRSRLFGSLMEIKISPKFRNAAFTSFSRVMGIDLSECRYPVESYKSLAHIFARTLADGCRPIEAFENSDSLCVPCDGEVVNISDLNFHDERITQLADSVDAPKLFSWFFSQKTQNKSGLVTPVKGATFRVEAFLGFDPRFYYQNTTQQTDLTDITDKILAGDIKNNSIHNETNYHSNIPDLSDSVDTKFVYTVIYLAPHNYHHFHSPCEFGIQTRRHMPGFVLPVFKGLAKRLNDLFSVNERVVLSGKWKYGQMHYSSVAAYNVGHIRLKYEPTFKTNCLRTRLYPVNRVMTSMSYIKPTFDADRINPTFRSLKKEEQPIQAHWVNKGERLGEFRLGSTVVLIFEVPKTFQWDVTIGQKVKMGQLLGHVSKLNHSHD